MEWPPVIEKDGETFRFSAERPGWLVYENDEHIILVGRVEACSAKAAEQIRRDVEKLAEIVGWPATAARIRALRVTAEKETELDRADLKRVERLGDIPPGEFTP